MNGVKGIVVYNLGSSNCVITNTISVALLLQPDFGLLLSEFKIVAELYVR